MDSKPSGMIANGCPKHFKGIAINIPLLFSYVKLQKTKPNKHTHKHHKSRINNSFEPVLFTEIVDLIHKFSS